RDVERVVEYVGGLKFRTGFASASPTFEFEIGSIAHIPIYGRPMPPDAHIWALVAIFRRFAQGPVTPKEKQSKH
ncbi:MAG: hypothetical protein QXO20_07915, partial [Candidatus Bathyarchaeia archaeon]